MSLSFFQSMRPPPVNHKIPYIGSADGVVPEPFSCIIDAFVGLGIASAVTSKINLGTSLAASSRAVVRFRNKRGTAKQWIKEGKQGVAITRFFATASALNPHGAEIDGGAS